MWSFASPDYKGEETAFENGRISDFQALVTLTLDRVILHTVMHQSSTSTYKPNFIKIKEKFCGRTDGRTFETHFVRSTRRSRPNKSAIHTYIHKSYLYSAYKFKWVTMRLMDVHLRPTYVAFCQITLDTCFQ